MIYQQVAKDNAFKRGGWRENMVQASRLVTLFQTVMNRNIYKNSRAFAHNEFL